MAYITTDCVAKVVATNETGCELMADVTLCVIESTASILLLLVARFAVVTVV